MGGITAIEAREVVETGVAVQSAVDLARHGQCVWSRKKQICFKEQRS